MGTLTRLAKKLPSAAKAAPPVVIAGPPVIGLTNIAPRVVQRADEASGTGSATVVAERRQSRYGASPTIKTTTA
ncbi:hypothetical protein PF005_g31298 [Phytophthora fragariae]|uniref:Uncharacterized protein n=1 Tax=Phytophthora fragariae TaxID=53985 RepID=A0A6A3DJN8_9STRA|nr:hypothetical protein PF003_g36856 [Phytophthora fragariae]KAE8919281.1 hypothetical protein PF009_g30409 [Phytophthora fragariae]KAE8962681.1 hypothetical protein PF011_g29295 [Phytophthora fragariae]KAE9062653.1 hypothetical protein PF007_g29838 [Phytophthora fragariae]KAE9067919.1 hypothetical protein PF006_g29895 [Phytophthora fragariae]